MPPRPEPHPRRARECQCGSWGLVREPRRRHVRSQAERGCAFWKREPGADGASRSRDRSQRLYLLRLSDSTPFLRSASRASSWRWNFESFGIDLLIRTSVSLNA